MKTTEHRFPMQPDSEIILLRRQLAAAREDLEHERKRSRSLSEIADAVMDLRLSVAVNGEKKCFGNLVSDRIITKHLDSIDFALDNAIAMKHVL